MEEGQSAELEEIICNDQGVVVEMRGSCKQQKQQWNLEGKKRKNTDAHAGIKSKLIVLQKPLRNLSHQTRFLVRTTTRVAQTKLFVVHATVNCVKNRNVKIDQSTKLIQNASI